MIVMSFGSGPAVWSTKPVGEVAPPSGGTSSCIVVGNGAVIFGWIGSARRRPMWYWRPLPPPPASGYAAARAVPAAAKAPNIIEATRTERRLPSMSTLSWMPCQSPQSATGPLGEFDASGIIGLRDGARQAGIVGEPRDGARRGTTPPRDHLGGG